MATVRKELQLWVRTGRSWTSTLPVWVASSMLEHSTAGLSVRNKFRVARDHHFSRHVQNLIKRVCSKEQNTQGLEVHLGFILTRVVTGSFPHWPRSERACMCV